MPEFLFFSSCNTEAACTNEYVLILQQKYSHAHLPIENEKLETKPTHYLSVILLDLHVHSMK